MAPYQGVQAMKGGWSGLIVKFLVVGIMLAASHHIVHYEPAMALKVCKFDIDLRYLAVEFLNGPDQ